MTRYRPPGRSQSHDRGAGVIRNTLSAIRRTASLDGNCTTAGAERRWNRYPSVGVDLHNALTELGQLGRKHCDSDKDIEDFFLGIISTRDAASLAIALEKEYERSMALMTTACCDEFENIYPNLSEVKGQRPDIPLRLIKATAKAKSVEDATLHRRTRANYAGPEESWALRGVVAKLLNLWIGRWWYLERDWPLCWTKVPKCLESADRAENSAMPHLRHWITLVRHKAQCPEVHGQEGRRIRPQQKELIENLQRVDTTIREALRDSYALDPSHVSNASQGQLGIDSVSAASSMALETPAFNILQFDEDKKGLALAHQMTLIASEYWHSISATPLMAVFGLGTDVTTETFKPILPLSYRAALEATWRARSSLAFLFNCTTILVVESIVSLRDPDAACKACTRWFQVAKASTVAHIKHRNRLIHELQQCFDHGDYFTAGAIVNSLKMTLIAAFYSIPETYVTNFYGDYVSTSRDIDALLTATKPTIPHLVRVSSYLAAHMGVINQKADELHLPRLMAVGETARALETSLGSRHKFPVMDTIRQPIQEKLKEVMDRHVDTLMNSKWMDYYRPLR
ncbi:hypothetical protein PUNSTDRAFT_46753 [Punctularia strigosozonata HHB-11173 SS5]|uniref:uncharacterized protein n=1 Tax=Punctularia strigosozonata (strain HHB-11173) TaxID=741275 RepID=UPI0004417D3B|nr:uncharacterized protein PUNSTDRAFT_46753 [Punctularia strigosozonata HHB-11173 SS5]EIN05340.1 hypothetical protein PUNSTDRAFT_46753 [Punctularia strigosozonata HHB-11173 SS5]